jgi:hypothetical protein
MQYLRVSLDIVWGARAVVCGAAAVVASAAAVIGGVFFGLSNFTVELTAFFQNAVICFLGDTGAIGLRFFSLGAILQQTLRAIVSKNGALDIVRPCRKTILRRKLSSEAGAQDLAVNSR